MIDKKSIFQFIKFGIVGLSNTIISYVVYLILIKFGIHYLIASGAGFVVSVLNSFFWNNKYVFTAKNDEVRNPWKTLAKTFISYAGTGLILSNILLVFWIEILKLPDWIGPILNLVITVPLNFVLNKLWAYKTKKENNYEEK